MLQSIVSRAFRRTESRAAGSTEVAPSLTRSHLVESVWRNPRFSPISTAWTFGVGTLQILHRHPRLDLCRLRIESKTINTNDLGYRALQLMAEAPNTESTPALMAISQTSELTRSSPGLLALKTTPGIHTATVYSKCLRPPE